MTATPDHQPAEPALNQPHERSIKLMQTIDEFLDQWSAAERIGDVATLDRLLTDDFVGVGPFGSGWPAPT